MPPIPVPGMVSATSCGVLSAIALLLLLLLFGDHLFDHRVGFGLHVCRRSLRLFDLAVPVGFRRGERLGVLLGMLAPGCLLGLSLLGKFLFCHGSLSGFDDLVHRDAGLNDVGVAGDAAARTEAVNSDTQGLAVGPEAA